MSKDQFLAFVKRYASEHALNLFLVLRDGSGEHRTLTLGQRALFHDILLRELKNEGKNSSQRKQKIGPATDKREFQKGIHISNNQETVDQLSDCFKELRQQACKSIAKAWVKAVEPKKQTAYPYRNGDRSKPPWWPKGVRHKEPDHLKKSERISLMLSIVFSQKCNVSLLQDSLERAELVIGKGRECVLSELFHILEAIKRYRDGYDDAVIVTNFAALESGYFLESSFQETNETIYNDEVQATHSSTDATVEEFLSSDGVPEELGTDEPDNRFFSLFNTPLLYNEHQEPFSFPEGRIDPRFFQDEAVLSQSSPKPVESSANLMPSPIAKGKSSRVPLGFKDPNVIPDAREEANKNGVTLLMVADKRLSERTHQTAGDNIFSPTKRKLVFEERSGKRR